MKIRNGFVSNSSSSSFVVIGVKRNGDSEEIMEHENFGKGIESLYIEEKNYNYVTGIILANVSSDGDYLINKSYSFAELQEMSQKVADALKVDVSEVKLVMGTRPS